MAIATTPTAALSAVAASDMGKAAGANSTLRQFGGAFGIAIATAVFAANGHSRCYNGFASPVWKSPMTPQKKQLYHQIHPLKLLTDWSTGIVAPYLLWRHDLIRW